jgi:hypothetical protein
MKQKDWFRSSLAIIFTVAGFGAAWLVARAVMKVLAR